jgi:NAD(P)-dependent dehydrogenase (short-subunit alcohol dehydrogenase family)
MLSNIKKLYGNDKEFTEAIVRKHPLGLGKPDDVASAVVYLLSEASRWMTGSVLTIDGGYGVR